MSNLNSTDITKRLQAAACCAGSLGNKVANEFKYGIKCADKDLLKLELLNSYIEILCEYEPLSDTETQATASFDVTLSAPVGTLAVRVNGVLLGTGSVSNPAEFATDLAISLNTSINSGTSTHGYTSSRSGVRITVSAPSGLGSIANGYPTTFTTTGNAGADLITAMSGGISQIIDGDQCLTEEQAQNMFEEISEICKTCFGTINYTYS